jgi:hypothetical protein
MGLDLVAEGVETVHQLRSLRELGCDKAQGFLISRPVPADAMRSTIVALDELQSLSLFGPTDEADMAPVLSTPVTAYRDAPSRQMLGGPIGSGSSRPLGQPLL